MNCSYQNILKAILVTEKPNQTIESNARGSYIMDVAAKLKYARLSPQKCRLICDQVRGKSVESALDILRFSTKKSGSCCEKSN